MSSESLFLFVFQCNIAIQHVQYAVADTMNDFLSPQRLLYSFVSAYILYFLERFYNNNNNNIHLGTHKIKDKQINTKMEIIESEQDRDNSTRGEG